MFVNRNKYAITIVNFFNNNTIQCAYPHLHPNNSSHSKFMDMVVMCNL